MHGCVVAASRVGKHFESALNLFRNYLTLAEVAGQQTNTVEYGRGGAKAKSRILEANVPVAVVDAKNSGTFRIDEQPLARLINDVLVVLIDELACIV